MSEVLDIVDDNDVVVGQAERDVAHSQGLRIRIVYVWFYTSKGEVILQRRGVAKQSNPGRLVSTVSGHVAAGDSYVEAAVRETMEETGIAVDPQALRLFAKVHHRAEHNGYITDGFRNVFLYEFTGSIDELAVEPEEGAGFELWKCDELLDALAQEPDNFGSFLQESVNQALIRDIAQGLYAS